MATVSHTPPTETRTTPGPLQLAGQFTLGVLLLVAVGLFGWMIFGRLAGDYESVDAKRAQERYKILADRQTDDYKYLHDQPSWFAKDKGLVRVPIDEAMRMTLPALRADQPHAAYPIATPTGDNGAPTSPDKGVGLPAQRWEHRTRRRPTRRRARPRRADACAERRRPRCRRARSSQTEATPAPGADSRRHAVQDGHRGHQHSDLRLRLRPTTPLNPGQPNAQ